jgi:hypothetical protein
MEGKVKIAIATGPDRVRDQRRRGANRRLDAGGSQLVLRPGAEQQ